MERDEGDVNEVWSDPLRPPTGEGAFGNPPPPGAPGAWSAPVVGPAQRDPGAVRSLVLGIIGLVFCPIIFSTAALYEGYQCRKRVRESNGRLTGEDLGLAGLVLGVVGLCLMPVWALLVLA